MIFSDFSNEDNNTNSEIGFTFPLDSSIEAEDLLYDSMISDWEVVTISAEITAGLDLTEIRFGLFHDSVSDMWYWLPIVIITSFGVIKASYQQYSDEDHEPTTRNEVFEVVKENPGIHFNEICRMLEKENGVIQYHLYILNSRYEEIVKYDDGGFTRYFPNTHLGRNDLYQKVWSMLRRESVGEFLNILYSSDKRFTRTELADIMEISPQAISWISKKAGNYNLIQKTRDGRYNKISLTSDALAMMNTIKEEELV